MDGYGAGVLPHAAALPAPALAHQGARALPSPYRTPCLFVGNNEYGTELFTFGKRKHLDRGELWFYVVKPRNPAEFALMVWRLCFGHLEQARDLDTVPS